MVRQRVGWPPLPPFTINIEHLKPFHTLTGRMHFYLAHDWIEELGEQLPVYRPPLDMARLYEQPNLGPTEEESGLPCGI